MNRISSNNNFYDLVGYICMKYLLNMREMIKLYSVVCMPREVLILLYTVFVHNCDCNYKNSCSL